MGIRNAGKRGLKSCVLLATVLVGSGAGGADAGAHPFQGMPSSHVLWVLRFGTGWILLGCLDIKSQKWATNLTHRVKERRIASDAITPLPGDVLEITMLQEIVIVDYASRGEQNRLVSPAGRRLERSDETGVRLPVGTEVLVEEVTRDPTGFSRNLQGVWVRVVAPRGRDGSD